KGERVDRSGMAAEGAPLATAAHIPQLYLPILTGRSEQAIAAREGDRRDAARVRPERALGTRGRSGPQPHRAGRATGGEAAAARRPLERACSLALAAPAPRQASGVCAPQPNAVVLTGGRQQAQ